MERGATITRVLTYIGTFAGLGAAHLYLHNSTWQGSAEYHAVVEAVATLLALLVGSMALVLFNHEKSSLYFFIGAGFLGAGLLGGYHAIASSPLFADFLLSTFPSLILWSGIASSLILSVSLWLSSRAWKREARIGEQGRIRGYMIYLPAGLLTLAGFLFLALFLLGPAYYPKIVIERPEDFVPALFFLLALVGYLRKGDWRHNVFEHWLVLSLIVGFASQAMFMPFSRHLFDEMSAAGHILKISSYLCVVIGLVFGMHHLFRRAEEMNEEMARVSQALEGKVAQRDQAYKALEKAHDAAEIWILERTAEIAQTNKMLETEIGERRRAEAALRESEERFRKIFDEGPLGMAIVDFDYRFVTVNNALCRMLGYSEQELTGLTIAEITHPEDIEEDEQPADFSVQIPRLNVEKRWVKKHGETVWIAFTATVVRDEDGKPLYGLAMIEEITERKQVEEAAENVQEVFWITSVNPTKVTYVSRAYEQIWGRKRDSLYKDCLPWLDGIHPEDQARVLGAIRKQTSREVSVEYRIVRPAGEICWIWGRAFPIRNERGEVSRIIGVATDVTERKRLEREILEISAREQRRIGQDLHDGLGQHLTGIAFLSTVLEQKLAVKSLEERAEAAEIAGLVNQAVTQTRDLARGLCPVKLEGDGLVQALQELAIKMESLFHVTCLFRCEVPVLIHDNAVATHLYYIAQEAATNAIKHGKAQHIVIGLKVAQDRIILMVKDDGIGFAATEEKRTGMGLHIMNYRASMIDAYLTVQSDAEGGTVVTCSLQHREIRTHGKKKSTKKSKPAKVKKERHPDRKTRTKAREKENQDPHSR